VIGKHLLQISTKQCKPYEAFKSYSINHAHASDLAALLPMLELVARRARPESISVQVQCLAQNLYKSKVNFPCILNCLSIKKFAHIICCLRLPQID